MRRRIAASMGLLGLIGAAWFGVRDHVVRGEPPTAQPALKTTVNTPVGTLKTTVIVQEEPELLPLVPTAAVPMAVSATELTFDALCKRLQPVLKKRFPKCGIKLIGQRDGLIIKGSAANAQEAATIVAAVQTVVDLNSPTEHPQSDKVVNQLEIPGEAQVMLSVKIIEADRNVVNEALQKSRKREQSKSQPEPKTPTPLATTQATASGVYSTSVVEEVTASIMKDSKSKTICEPTLAVVSGRCATFVSGGEFAVPTIVGAGDSKETSTTFRRFGTTVEAVTTVIDNDQLRLELMCESSQVDKANMTAGVPGINVRRINTLAQLHADQSLVMELPSHANVESYQVQSKESVRDIRPIPTAARKQDKSANSERCLFIIVTPKVLNPTEINEVLPHPIASLPHVYTANPNGPWPSVGVTDPIPNPPGFHHTERTPPVRDLLLRTPIPATKGTQPFVTPQLPPVDPFGNPIQQLGAWQPLNAAPMP